ncbi:MAG: hypothetical protein UW11_C0040G0009 [Parcubacteria group bacterium GW2011_GWA2_43_9b]|nr:MAG: hypothetical protein UW11_C0040G0009 [Parcubacteria group bacterium GW2011_GWA2_43_9b]
MNIAEFLLPGMSREKIFKLNNQEEPKIEASVAPPEEPADWEIKKAQHLSAKEKFHKSRMVANRTGEEKYQANKSKKYIKNPEDRLM